eukprot:1736590-Rhodomonas_salina.1
MQSVASSLSAGALEFPEHDVRLPPEQNVSAGHCEHGPPAGPENPSLQIQSVPIELCFEELLLLGHLFVSLPPGHQYPSAHCVHSLPSGPEYPALHVQFSGSELRAADQELFVHEVIDPETHHDPSGHSEQFPPSGPK